LFDSPTPASGTVLVIPVARGLPCLGGIDPGSGVASSFRFSLHGARHGPVAVFVAPACVRVVQALKTGLTACSSDLGI